MKPRHGQVAAVVGSVRPAMSISWDKAGAADFFVIFFADRLPGDDGFDELSEELVCLQCLLDEGDEQIGRGLDMARRFGQADHDEIEREWFVPVTEGE